MAASQILRPTSSPTYRSGNSQRRWVSATSGSIRSSRQPVGARRWRRSERCRRLATTVNNPTGGKVSRRRRHLGRVLRPVPRDPRREPGLPRRR